MRVLRLTCKSCSAVFESGVPLRREHLEGVKLRALEVCPGCGAAADYRGEDYADPRPSPQDIPAAGARHSRSGQGDETMSEPRAVATSVEPVVDGVWLWTVSDDRIGGAPSSAVAVEESRGSVVVVNPLRLEPGELHKLGTITAILLTGASHVRAAEHYREEVGASLWAPVRADLRNLAADETFADGDDLPGGLKAIALPGPSDHESAFYLERGGGVMIVGDALMNIPGYGGFRVLPEEHNPDVAATHKSCAKLLDYDFEVMVFGHGEPIRGAARGRLKELLAT